MIAVTVSNLAKVYPGNVRALDNVNFTLKQGEVFGLLGPNGAGKTTAIKLMTGMLKPTEGVCNIFDINPSSNPQGVHQLSGVVTEHAQMYDPLTGIQNLVFYGKVFGMSETDSKKRGHLLLEQLGLTDAKDRKLAAYSTGMRQRLSLARAMMHSPKILFLDEPTSGLDPESTQQVNGLIARLAKEEGITVLLCTHQLRYAQEVCTTYGLVDKGTLLACGTLEELNSQVFPGLRVKIEADSFPPELQTQNIAGKTGEFIVQSEEEIPALVKKIVTNGGSIYHVSKYNPSLEEIYFAMLNKRKERAVAK